MSISSISSSTISSMLQGTVSRLQTQLQTASTESSTGLLADIGLTLGSDSGQDVVMHQQMADLAAISASNAVVTAQQATASNALTNLQSSASTMLSTVIGGAADTPGSTGAIAIQQNAASALDSFASLANAQVGGQYVFGGVNTGVAPIATYAGGAAQTAVDNAPSRRCSPGRTGPAPGRRPPARPSPTASAPTRRLRPRSPPMRRRCSNRSSKWRRACPCSANSAASISTIPPIRR